ncbi:hypothetical protein M413DRAFT_26808 [Hebeloma cylindrosporum]|uniref:Protein kinase domain-containing protein n=1 Tax=Hebeloma cylindrosporum TaxID=76867 RepID=A0A0C2XYW7_HEBCY|nr:hypothetical protein M413DRAFT_26808 [Hebeloma cylindrosporum h7]
MTSVEDDEDEFSPILKRAFAFSYPAEISQGPRPSLPLLPPRASPIAFYDRHIASNLVLKQVIYLPSLVQGISKAGDELIATFLGAGHNLNYPEGFVLHEWDDCPVPFDDAHSVNSYYSRRIANVCIMFGSIFHFHPDCQSWSTLLSIRKTTNDGKPRFLGESWLKVRDKILEEDLQFSDDSETEFLDGVGQGTTDKVRDIGRRYPRFATWEMFAMTDVGISLVKNATPTTTDFSWEFSRTLGSRTVSYSPVPPDTIVASQFIPALKTKRSRAPTKVVVTDCKKQPVTKTSASIRPSNAGTSLKQRGLYRPEPRYYLQHAWAKAVVHDSTFIMLHCGRYERIGIRHRASQTLYLSGLIDTVNNRNPRYRKLQVALCSSIIQDLLERYELATAPMKTGGSKRPAANEPLDVRIPKRRKAASPDCTVSEQPPAHYGSYDKITKALGRKMLGLVSLRYGPYCSPTPASFIRIGSSCAPSLQPKPPRIRKLKAKYQTHEYFTLMLGPPLGDGATGIVHPAALEIQVKYDTGMISTLRRNDLVVKLAFEEEQKTRMQHEFTVYAHLAKKNVTGVPIVHHGLFNDPDSGTLALLMDNVGQNLREREEERTGEQFPKQVSTTKEERRAFVAVMKSIHKAGIKHMDIRADNLVIHPESGKVAIIDFDRAKFPAENMGFYDVEMECLKDLLHGRFTPDSYW